jgi:hypothetical protein
MKLTTVKDMKDLLNKFPDDYVVLSSNDEEGNIIKPISGDYAPGLWSEQDGEFLSEEDVNDAIKEGYDVEPYVENAVLLWP